MAGKFYWLKLKEDFFQQEAIEWLEEQKNGKEYSLFYLKLCLNALKDGGILVRQIGTKTIPYTAKKLGEVTSTSPARAEQAIKLLKDIGLVVERKDGVLFIPGLAEMVGSESSTKEAVKKREQRLRKRRQEGDITGDNLSPECPSNVHNLSSQKGTNCPTEIRDKILDTRYYYYDDDDNNPISYSSLKDEVDTKAIVNTTSLNTTTSLEEEVYSKSKNSNKNSNNNTNLDSGNNIFSLWEKNVSPLTPIVVEKLQALVDEVGEEAVKYGIETACTNNARTLGYISACARNYLGGRKFANGINKINDVEGAARKVIEALERGEGDRIWG